MNYKPKAPLQITVALAGTRQQVTTDDKLNVRSVVIQAHPDNTGRIYVGGADVDATHSVILTAGQSVTLEVQGDYLNLSSVWLDSSQNAQIACLIYPMRF